MYIKRLVKKIQHVGEMTGTRGAKSVFTTMDLCYWQLFYHLLPTEYFFYEFNKKGHRDRMQYVRDYEVMHGVPQKFNTGDYEIFDDKKRFNENFSDYLCREWILPADVTFELFNDFCDRHEELMIKNRNLWGGNGIFKIFVSEVKDRKKLYDELKEKRSLVEEVVKQNESLAQLNSSTLNTIRVISMIDDFGSVHIPFANIRIGRINSDVDNFCSGGGDSWS